MLCSIITEQYSITHDWIYYCSAICNLNYSDYKKLIFETDEISTIILKLGEDSNLALFFQKELDIDQKLKSIRRYIKKIENLIDMPRIDIYFQELEKNEEEIKELQTKQKVLQDKIKEYQKKVDLKASASSDSNIEESLKEIKDLNEQISILQHDIEERLKEIDSINEKINQERKK